MSLYTNTKDTLRMSGAQKATAFGIGGLAHGIGSTIAGALGLKDNAIAQTAVNYGASAASNAARNLMNKYIPMQQQRALAVGTGAIGDIMAGDFQGAGMRVLESGLIDDLLPGMAGVATQTRFFATRNPLMGGITPAMARGIIEEMQMQKFARTNLFTLEVTSPIESDFGGVFNMFATSVEVTPNTITGEKRKIGGAIVDSVQSAESTELSITTLDNTVGRIKRWFEAHCAKVAPINGTIGLPSEYAITITVIHAALDQDTAGVASAYKNKGIFRPNNMELSLSRRDNELQEVRMTFSQLDTFMKMI